MLILNRKAGQAIRISGGITVRIVATSTDGTVKVGIEAPDSVRIQRDEVRGEDQRQPTNQGGR